MSYFNFTPYGPGLTPTDISQVSNDNFLRLQRSITDITDSGGWTANALPNVSTVTYNGNRSYDLTFTGTINETLSPGMRLKTVRTVAAPTQCTSLNGTSQYWTKASPSGISFTSTWTAMAWIKLNSYSSLSTGIIGRDSTAAVSSGWEFGLGGANQGQLIIYARNASGNIVATSYQAIPLNKWTHVAGTMNASTGAMTLYIDGVAVPASTSVAGTSVVQASTNLTVGWRNSTSGSGGYFPGKIAQVALFSSVLSQATIQSYISQGLSGSESNLISAFSFNGNANDLNTTNANNLTASGSATATNADSAFSVNGSGTATGTDDYAIVQAVTSTVATVSLPAGCTIPTSGGISGTYTSTQKNPFNWVLDKDRWEVLARNKTLAGQASPVNGTWYNLGSIYLNVPKGIWDLRYENNFYCSYSVSQTVKILSTLSTLTNNESDRRYTVDSEFASLSVLSGYANITNTVNLSAATTYYILTVSQVANGGTLYNLGDRAEVAIKALPSGL